MRSHRKGLTHVVHDGRIELDNNAVDRSFRPITPNRENVLLGGSDGGTEPWRIIASLIETRKLNDVEQLTYLIDARSRIVNGHANNEIDLLPWPTNIKTSKLCLKTALPSSRTRQP
jgi:transposase